MGQTENRIPLGRIIGIAAIAAVVSAVASTFVQHLIMGDANPAVTGGITGGVVGGVIAAILNRKSKGARRDE